MIKSGRSAPASFIAMLLLCGVAFGQTLPWWNRAWRCRRLVAAARPSDQRIDTFWIEFYNAGYTRKHGEDIRVIGRDKTPIPYRVIWHAQGGLTRLAIRLETGTATYAVYYGNPKAPAYRSSWRPQSGLLLETRPYRGGQIRNWSQVRAVLKATAEDAMGRGYVDNVFQGYNPFGPSGRCISLYKGTLIVPRNGTYGFATSSDDASFLLLDGRMVVQWPGWHGAAPRAHFRKTVKLKQGFHAFEYYHVAARARQICVAAWQTPWMKKNEYKVIPASAFLRTAQGRLTKYEILARDIVPDFRVENLGEVHAKGTILVRYRFTDQSGIPTGKKTKQTWSFGDGLVGEGHSADHIYFRPGRRRVTLTLAEGGKKHRVSHLIEATQDWSRQTDRKLKDKLDDYLPTLRRYPLEDLAVADLLAANRLYREKEFLDDVLRTSRALTARAAELNDESLIRVSGALTEAYGTSGRLRAEAVASLRKLEGAADHVDTKGEIAAALAEFLFRGEALKPAREAAERALKDYEDLPEKSQRRLYIVLGDVAREEGEERQAREWYGRAEAIKLAERRFAREAVREGAFTRAIEDFIRQRHYEGAEELLDRLEWEYPTAKLDGYSTVLRGRILWGAGRIEQATKVLERMVATMPKNQFADDALLLAAEIYMSLRPAKKRQATDALERMLKDYPESGRVNEAHELLKKAQGGT